ncbi:MAG: sugar transporter ATP-binding protein [Haloplasmataceae bacterium]|jgi:multiple sugar transport system ATP-binding protein|nr:sugar transporter ATP-binding protein [Haloplasmataceae bacterium]
MEVRLEGLTKQFTETIAVDNVSVTFESGKLIGLLGPSGCGKSTTLFMISGLLKPTKGKIYFGNDDVTNLAPEKRGIGLVFQNYALYPHMTVQQNIMFPLENLKLSRQEALERTKEMATLVGINELLDRKPAQLSGGQQQRVAIARALVKKPRVLLLDEPLSNLDARLRLQTREEIRRIQRETGITTIFVTHDQEEAMSISDKIIVMSKGLVQQEGIPQVVYNKPINLFVSKFLGNPPINTFDGKISNGKIIIGDIELGKTNCNDQNVVIGIRPEDFKVAEDGFEVSITDLSRIGRDTTVYFNLNGIETRALINSEEVSTVNKIKLKVKREKIHLFNPEAGDCINE